MQQRRQHKSGTSDLMFGVAHMLSCQSPLIELAAWFANAEYLLVCVQRQMIGHELTASDVRCWPHHFDLATLISFPTRETDVTGYVGAGLSPGDEYYNEP
jgi:hypothetical protein